MRFLNRSAIEPRENGPVFRISIGMRLRRFHHGRAFREAGQKNRGPRVRERDPLRALPIGHGGSPVLEEAVLRDDDLNGKTGIGFFQGVFDPLPTGEKPSRSGAQIHIPQLFADMPGRDICGIRDEIISI